ncbi:MAG: hypothetical protein HGA45_32035 [Chloroflexales bacterium]|nr:hypothetical protein [Chloroflexales bacterium]
MGGDRQHDLESDIPDLHPGMIAKLPQYVAVVLAGGDPAASYPAVAAHLVVCPACASELLELIDLAVATYTDGDELPPIYPAPDLSSLSRAEIKASHRRWRIDDLGRLLLEITDDLLAMARPSPLFGLARADDLLYDLALPPESPDAPDLRLEIFHDDRAAPSVRLRLSIELPGRDVFDAAGTPVALLALGDPPAEWWAVTDAVGTASFSGVPRQALAGMRIAVTADRSA